MWAIEKRTIVCCQRYNGLPLKLYLYSQDLVYKIVPELEADEFKRERKFYSERGLPCPKDQALEQESEEKRAAEAEAAMTPDANTNMDFHRFDEQVSLKIS